MRLRWLGTTGLICALCGSFTVGEPRAGAQAQPDYDAARKHYMAGKQAQAAGDYEAAIASYIQAYDITKDPSLFKPIAVAYEAAGKKREALVYYRRYLAEAKSGPDFDAVRAKVAQLEAALGAPAETKPPAGSRPPAEAPPPESKPPVAEPSQPVKIEPLPPLPEAPAMVQESGGGWQRTAAWISVGLTAAAATTGAVLATSSKSREEDIRQLIETRDPITHRPLTYAGSVRTDYEDKVDEGEKLRTYATVAFIGAGAFAGAAVVFFILDATRTVEPHAAVTPLPGGAGVVLGWGF